MSALLTRLSLHQWRDVMALQEAVLRKVAGPLVMPKTVVTLRGFLDGRLGVAYGMVERDRLVAMSLLRIPSEERPNRDDVPFPLVPHADWPLHACFLESTLVLPAARGRGYHRLLIDARRPHAVAAGMRWVCAGVHVANISSWRNLLAAGMAIVGMRLDFGYPIIGLLARSDWAPLPTDPSDDRRIDLADAEQHEATLHAGYVGVGLERDQVVYRRLRSAR